MSELTASDDVVTRNQEKDLRHRLFDDPDRHVSLETESGLRRAIERLKRMIVPSRGPRRYPGEKSG